WLTVRWATGKRATSRRAQWERSTRNGVWKPAQSVHGWTPPLQDEVGVFYKPSLQDSDPLLAHRAPIHEELAKIDAGFGCPAGVHLAEPRDIVKTCLTRAPCKNRQPSAGN